LRINFCDDKPYSRKFMLDFERQELSLREHHISKHQRDYGQLPMNAKLTTQFAHNYTVNYVQTRANYVQMCRFCLLSPVSCF
jgi:hypothetical protein